MDGFLASKTWVRKYVSKTSEMLQRSAPTVSESYYLHVILT